MRPARHSWRPQRCCSPRAGAGTPGGSQLRPRLTHACGAAGLLEGELGQEVAHKLLLPDHLVMDLVPGISVDVSSFFASHVLPAAGQGELAEQILR